MSKAVVLGVDGGNTKTDVVAAALDGRPLAFLRGDGSNSHGPGGAEGCIDVVAELVAAAGLDDPAVHGAFFICGADVPDDVAALQSALSERSWVREATVANDAFALLYTAGGADAVAVVCGGGMNCIGRTSDGRVSRRSTLGWETGDWGGAEDVGREALHHAVRAEDLRGPDTALVDAVRTHFGMTTALEVGEAVHYRRLPQTRLGELAPLVVAAAEEDAVAAQILDRLAGELVLLVRRASRDLDLSGREFDVVLGGGMFEGRFRERFAARLHETLARASVIVPDIPPAAGAALAALEAVGAPASAASTLRAAFAAGYPPQVVHG